MHNTNKQTLVVPFYVCDVTQPIMSVTRLAEQGFNTQLNETPTITHSKGFNSVLRQREGLYFLPVILVTLPANMRLEVNQTTEGTTARTAPVTLTPAGMEILRNKNDLCTFNSQGFLVRVHRTQRKALFMPDSRCPVPTERLENYRRTVIQRPNSNTEVIEEAYQDLDKKQPKRVIEGHNWTGETWFKVKRGTPLPGNIPPQPALPPAKGPTPATSRQLTADEPQEPMYRHNVKKPLTEARPTGQAMTSTQTHQTAIPHPKEVSPTQDYWIKEGPYWKRVHVQPRRDMYIPQQTDDRPDVTKLTTWRQTMVKPTSWQPRIQNWRWLDNKEESNTPHRLDRLNKLWREHSIQRWVHHRWSRGATRSKESNRTTNTTTTNRTRTKRTWTDTPSIQKLVSNMRTKQRKTRQPPKTNKQNTSDPSGSDVLQSIRRETNNIGPHSSGRWNRYVHGSSTGRQDPTRAIPVNLPTTIPDGMRQNTCNSQQHCPTIRPGRLHHLLAQDGGNSSGQQHAAT